MRVGIATINSSNYGNRLQNYAVQEILIRYGAEPVTIKNTTLMNKKKNNLDYFIRNFKHLYHRKEEVIDSKEREKCFIEFNKNIYFSKKTFNWFDLKWLNHFDYFIVGSDQVWNSGFRLSNFDMLTFTEPQKRIAFSASIAMDNMREEFIDIFGEEVRKFKAISVREKRGKEIVESHTKRDDVELLVDPTMLLTDYEWDKVAKKPKKMKSLKYILIYFLGKLSEERYNEILRIAQENNCEIINLLDKNSEFYGSGPSEFLYLEKNAFLICTDSFHSCVFAILYNKPFVVFNREEEGNFGTMNSRVDTLLTSFQLKERMYNGKQITKENLQCDYSETYKILNIERLKANNFIKTALEIKETNYEKSRLN